jgi:hypothetical protein
VHQAAAGRLRALVARHAEIEFLLREALKKRGVTVKEEKAD